MTGRTKDKFHSEPVEMGTVEELEEYLAQLGENWLFRAQPYEYSLTTSLERSCIRSGYDLEEDAEKIEENMMRQFARVYDGIDREKVKEDKLYCLSVMRHFGAPARLLDCTYSRYVAIYFALEYAYKDKERRAAIWCFNMPGLVNAVREKIEGIADLIDKRKEDKTRNNTTFEPLYMQGTYTFVGWENPIQLHRRLHLQQGVFLCPGNIGKSFEANLAAVYDRPTRDIRKVVFRPDDLRAAFSKYYRLNLTRESLFPGLDGFAQSMEYQLWLYRKLDDWRRDDFGEDGVHHE